MDAMVIGGIALDDVELPDVNLKNVVGGSAVYGSLAASLFTPTKLGGIAGCDFPETFLKKLLKHNITLDYVQKSKKPSFRWKARYSSDLSQITVTNQQLNAMEDFKIDGVSQAINKCGAVFISNNDPEVQLKLVRQMPKNVIKILDSMDIWMIEKKDILLEVIKRVDIFFLSQTEAGYLAEHSTRMYQIIDHLLGLGPKVIVIKKGEYGLSAYGAIGTLTIPSYPLTHVVDPSGAGDALGGSFAGILSKLGRLDRESLATAVLVGSTVASFVVEGYVTEPFETLTINEVVNRAKMFLTQLPQVNTINLSALSK